MTYVSGQYTSKQLMDNIFEVEDALPSLTRPNRRTTRLA